MINCNNWSSGDTGHRLMIHPLHAPCCRTAAHPASSLYTLPTSVSLTDSNPVEKSNDEYLTFTSRSNCRRHSPALVRCCSAAPLPVWGLELGRSKNRFQVLLIFYFLPFLLLSWAELSPAEGRRLIKTSSLLLLTFSPRPALIVPIWLPSLQRSPAPSTLCRAPNESQSVPLHSGARNKARNQAAVVL